MSWTRTCIKTQNSSSSQTPAPPALFITAEVTTRHGIGSRMCDVFDVRGEKENREDDDDDDEGDGDAS